MMLRFSQSELALEWQEDRGRLFIDLISALSCDEVNV